MSPSNRSAAASCLIPAGFDEALVTQAVEGCRAQIHGAPDLVLVAASSDYRPHLAEVIEILRIDGRAPRIVGCSAGGVLGVGSEHENASGISILFLRLPETHLEVHTEASTLARPGAGGDPGGCLVFGNPLYGDLARALGTCNTAFPGLPAAGGWVTGGPEEEDLFLFTEEGLVDTGLLAVTFEGGLRLVPLVSQSCRPIGEPFVVTGARAREILSIGRREPFAVLEETFESLADEIQEAADGNVFAGLAISEEVDEFDTGNFQISHIVGANLEKGRLVLEANPRVGQTMQFQLRDGQASEYTLRREAEAIRDAEGKPFAGFLCAGQGRGRKLYGAEDRDIRLLEEILGRFPVAGFFSNGEVGPTSGRLFRHDHSLCGLLFYEPAAAPSAEEASS